MPKVIDALFEGTRRRIDNVYPLLITKLEMSFDEFSEMAIRIFGTHSANDLFPRTFIIKVYGSKNVKRWKELAKIEIFL